MQIKISVFVVFISLFVLSIFAQAGTAADLAGNWISFENSGFTQKPMVSQKIERLSSAFRKKPYMSDPGPLGEGSAAEFDRSPLYRFDGFDCTTFVETVIALAKSQNVREFEETMNRIRYKDGIIKFENRNHFTGLDWVPNNIQAGFLIDITSEIAGPHPTALTEALIEKSGWYAHLTADRIQGFTNQEVSQKLSSLHRMGSVFENQTEIVRYIKLDTIIENPEVLQLIPSGSVINVVRPNWDIKDKIGTNMNISHQGFVIQSSGRTLFRHASQTEKKVSEDNLLDYLKSMKSVPSIDGIQVLKVTE